MLFWPNFLRETLSRTTENVQQETDLLIQNSLFVYTVFCLQTLAGPTATASLCNVGLFKSTHEVMSEGDEIIVFIFL